MKTAQERIITSYETVAVYICVYVCVSCHVCMHRRLFDSSFYMHIHYTCTNDRVSCWSNAFACVLNWQYESGGDFGQYSMSYDYEKRWSLFHKDQSGTYASNNLLIQQCHLVLQKLLTFITHNEKWKDKKNIWNDHIPMLFDTRSVLRGCW